MACRTGRAHYAQSVKASCALKSESVLSAAKGVAVPTRASVAAAAEAAVFGVHHQKHQYKLVYALRAAAVFQHQYHQEQSENIVLHNSSVKNVYAHGRRLVRILSTRSVLRQNGFAP